MTEYSETFKQAVENVLRHEGGFVNDPDDPGGATNYGISLRFIRNEVDGTEIDGLVLDKDQDGDIDADDIRQLSHHDTIDIYYRFFWDRYGYDSLRPEIAGKVFDLCVNIGPRPAHKLLQQSVWAAGDERIANDGIIGPNTIRAAGDIQSKHLLVALRSEAAGFYRVLVAKRPKLSKYKDGWLNRAYD